MSLDDAIYLQTNAKGKIVAQWADESSGYDYPNPEEALFSETFETILEAMIFFEDAAKKTAYGFLEVAEDYEEQCFLAFCCSCDSPVVSYHEDPAGMYICRSCSS